VNHYTLFGGLFDPIGTARIRSRSIAAYAQADYDITSALTFTLGGRYTHDRRRIDFTLSDSGVPLPAFMFNPATHPDLARQSDNLYSFRGALQWKPNSQTMLFASVNRGTKGGNFALPFFLPAAPGIIPFKPEVLYSYEVGEKWTSADGVLRVNATAFYYDYKNYQAYIFAAEPGFNPVGTIRNLPAKAKGVELELTLKPVDGLTLGANLVGMDSKIKGVILPNGDSVDRKLPQAPSFSGNGLIRYEMPVAGGKVAAIQANVVWQSKMSFTAISAPDEREGAWSSGDLRISLGSQSGSWEAAIFARNLWNDHHRIWAYDLSTFGTAAQIYARPRTIGASFRYNFN
jgi:iron complex outermembrane receptor protein